MRITYLADYPESIPLVAKWFYEEWGQFNPNSSLALSESRVRERLNRDRIPLTLVALQNDEVVATTTLKIREMDIYPQYEYWLSNVYTRPDCRGRGFGSQLVEYTVEEAKRLGVHDLYLQTWTSEKLYTRLGWQALERDVEDHGKLVTVMKRVVRA